jgi:hypothetical protein
MSRTRICEGRMIGCQPAIDELSELWELSLRGVDSPDRELLLTHDIAGRERVRQENLEKLVKESGDPSNFSNVTLAARQRNPYRDIQIQLGPGYWTSVVVEADDHTWAIGRYSEIMEHLARTRKALAMGQGHVAGWPKRRPHPVRNAANGFVRFIGSGILAIGIALAGLVALWILLDPIRLGIYAAHHNDYVPVGDIYLLPFSIGLVAGLGFFVNAVIRASQAKVTIHAKPLWTAPRIAAITTVTAVVGAITGIVALFVK